MFKLGQCRCPVLPVRPGTPVKCHPKLSAWEVSATIRGLPADTLACVILARLAASDRELLPGRTQSGTQRSRHRPHGGSRSMRSPGTPRRSATGSAPPAVRSAGRPPRRAAWRATLVQPVRPTWPSVMRCRRSLLSGVGCLLLLSPLLSTAGLGPYLQGLPAAVTAPCPAQAPPPDPTAAEPGDRRVRSRLSSRVHEPCSWTEAVALRLQTALTGSGSHRSCYGGFGGGYPRFRPHAGCRRPDPGSR